MSNGGLTLCGAVGTSLESAHVIVGDPDEIDGDTFARVWLASFRAPDALEITERLDAPVYSAWMSDNGTLYCCCLDGTVQVRVGGTWAREELGGYAERIIGFGGDDPTSDVVVACGPEGLFVREGGRWRHHAFGDEVEMTFGLHGRSPDSIYICTDGEGLLRWNGRGYDFVDMPYAEEPSGVLVSASDDLLVTADDIHLRVGGAWSTPEHGGGSPTIAVAELGKDVFVGTSEGIVRWRGGAFELVPGDYCNVLAGVGDAVIGGQGFEGTEVRVFDGARWRTVPLPAAAD